MTNTMTQFWTIGVAGRNNTFTERYYSFEEAQEAAINKAKLDPSTTYLVLKLEGYTTGEYLVNINFEKFEEDNSEEIENGNN